MELIKKCKNANSFFSAQEVETQIRAAIKEFAEMAHLDPQKDCLCNTCKSFFAFMEDK